MIIFAETDEVWTFNDINRQSNQLANYFLSIGYQKGDAIAVFMENHPKFMVVILALAKIGAVASLINNHLTQEVNYECSFLHNLIEIRPRQVWSFVYKRV